MGVEGRPGVDHLTGESKEGNVKTGARSHELGALY